MTTSPDLRGLFNQRYIIKTNPEDAQQYIPCPSKLAEVYLFGPGTLACHFMRVRSPQRVADRITTKIPAAKIIQHGDYELVIVCPLSDAKQFLAAVGAQRRVQLSAAERAARADRLRAVRPVNKGRSGA